MLSLQSPHGLRWIVPEGALLPLDRGSAGHVLRRRIGASDRGPAGSSRSRSGSRAWPRSAPACAALDGAVLAAVSVSGPVERLRRQPGARFGHAVVAAARAIEVAVAG